jgi:hypothetical protein
MPIFARLALALLLALGGTASTAAYTLEERPTVTVPLELPPELPVLDGGFAARHWLTGAMPVPFWVNPTNAGLPLIVPPGRDQDEEFVRAIRRTFERWEDVKTSTLTYQFAGLTDRPAGVFDGTNAVGWSLPGQCAPFVGGFNMFFRLLLTARVDDTSPVTVGAFIKAPPFVFDFGNGHVVEVREPGQILESDTVICSEFQY